MQTFFDQHNRRVELGRELGRGGEAVAYELQSTPSMVVKIYHEVADQLKSEKLEAMVNISQPVIARFAAWPNCVIRKTMGGPIAGIIMPKVVGVEIHKLYNPSVRKIAFPSADWRFLIRTACNYATAIETLHQHGIVIGDINQGNALVADDAIVRFIDCDSFQITTGTKIFRCPVGVPLFTPPELQSGQFNDKDRTVNHDRFGLAIMIFHLLFAGRHPFAGRYNGSGENSLEEMIKAYRFAFGRNHKLLQIDPPPFTPLLKDMPSEVSELFEKAFKIGSAAGNRPSATEWRNALKNFEQKLTQCGDDPGHYYLSGNNCPWCRISSEGGPNLFISVSYARTQNQLSSFDPKAIENAIKSFPSDLGTRLRYNPKKLVFVPEKAKHDASLVSSETFLFLKVMMTICLIGSGFLFILSILPGAIVFAIATVFLFIVLLYLNSSYFTKELSIAKINREKEVRIEDLRKKLKAKIDSAEHAIRQEKDGFIRQLNKLKALDTERANAFRQLESQAEQRQLEDHLSNFLICDARIPGIGPARVATLESYGIDSALDIQKDVLERIPGFGSNLIGTLLAWQSLVIRDFRFDKTKGIPARDRQNIDHRYNQQKVRLQKVLLNSPSSLRKLFEEHKNSIQSFIRSEGLE